MTIEQAKSYYTAKYYDIVRIRFGHLGGLDSIFRDIGFSTQSTTPVLEARVPDYTSGLSQLAPEAINNLLASIFEGADINIVAGLFSPRLAVLEVVSESYPDHHGESIKSPEMPVSVAKQVVFYPTRATYKTGLRDPSVAYVRGEEDSTDWYTARLKALEICGLADFATILNGREKGHNFSLPWTKHHRPLAFMDMATAR